MALDLEQLGRCARCARMRRHFRALRKSHPDYWNRPVPPSGEPGSRLLIVGLAPGMHGANRTGEPFVGDAAGDLLFSVLDTLDLRDSVCITNAVKCLPVKNLPNGSEIALCQRFLRDEVIGREAILALGGVAHRAVLRALDERQAAYPFAHGNIHRIDGIALVDSYHCSRYNTQTGRLTEAMFLDVVKSAAIQAGLPIVRR